VPHRADAVPGLPPFQGGAAGYIAYDWGRVLERLPAPRYDDLGLPDVLLGIYDWVLAWDHQASRAWLISTGLPETSSDRRARRAGERAAAVRARLSSGAGPVERGTERDTAGAPAPSYPVEASWDRRLELRSSFTHGQYLDAVARVRDYIFAGDIFQTNLSQRFEAPLAEDPWTFYRRLRTRNAAPFAAFFDFPGATVLSASPERFLQVDTGGSVETRPIKGTRPRGLGPEHDFALGQALTESSKDQAENLMIVDLMRNDLSRVCAPGTVRVPELFTLEHYATVHHLVSTVVGTLAEGRDALDLLRAAFPGGSITGAPKVRAMEIIAELEPSERSVYCGSIGYWSVTGALDTSIAIRTALARGGRVYFSAGGGIVADSDPEQEYRETLDKARGIIDVLGVPHDPAHR
jgi:para-aminobenzoate synthetase component 1